MLLLLDTSAISELIRENPKLRNRLQTITASDKLITCTIVRGEILFGIERLPAGKRRDALRLKAENVLARIDCEPIPPLAADQYATIKSSCERRGISLSDNDVWIAATAITIGAALISQDQDFMAVEGLTTQNWIA